MGVSNATWQLRRLRQYYHERDMCNKRQKLHWIRRSLLGVLFLFLLAGFAFSAYVFNAELDADLDWVTYRRHALADFVTNTARITFMIRVPRGEAADVLYLSIWVSPPKDTIDEWDPKHASRWTVFPGDRGPWTRRYVLPTSKYMVRLDRALEGKWKRVFTGRVEVIR